uniref:Ribosomal protein S15 n=1 Tax=Schizophyllum commune (strain H4-8 / FGSC 9210) TaxID=578458 RepID=D8PM27_SCHCM
MLRALSASRPPAPTAARAFSTSASAAGGHRVRKTHNALKEQRWVREQARRPNPVLGTRPGEEWKWDKCDLAKILVLEKDFASIPVTEARHKEQLPVGEVEMPQQFAYGVHNEEKKVLFRYLPYLSATTEVLVRGLPYFLIQSLTEPTAAELQKSQNFAKLIDLRNTNAAGLAYENRKRIIATFSDPSKPDDPGRTEVQVAILTYRIRKLYEHLTGFKRDVGNRLPLRKLVHQRAKLLRYLKRVDRARWNILLERCGLEPDAVEGELIV